LARFPHRAIEHHWRFRRGEASQNRTPQSSAAQMRTSASLVARSIASAANAANADATGSFGAGTSRRSRPSARTRRGGGAGAAAAALFTRSMSISAGRPSASSTRSIASRNAFAASTFPAVTGTGPVVKPASSSHSASASGPVSISTPSAYRERSVLTRSRHGRPPSKAHSMPPTLTVANS
jgi:hypothetical protein